MDDNEERKTNKFINNDYKLIAADQFKGWKWRNYKLENITTYEQYVHNIYNLVAQEENKYYRPSFITLHFLILEDDRIRDIFRQVDYNIIENEGAEGIADIVEDIQLNGNTGAYGSDPIGVNSLLDMNFLQIQYYAMRAEGAEEKFNFTFFETHKTFTNIKKDCIKQALLYYNIYCDIFEEEKNKNIKCLVEYLREKEINFIIYADYVHMTGDKKETKKINIKTKNNEKGFNKYFTHYEHKYYIISEGEFNEEKTIKFVYSNDHIEPMINYKYEKLYFDNMQDVYYINEKEELFLLSKKGEEFKDVLKNITECGEKRKNEYKSDYVFYFFDFETIFNVNEFNLIKPYSVAGVKIIMRLIDEKITYIFGG